MDFLEPIVDALILVLLLSAIPLAASLVVGLVISVLQAATQIQEMTLSFVPKLLTIAAVLFLCGDWMGQQLIQYCHEMLIVAATM